MDVDENGEERTPTQFITTTFRPELIRAGSQFYGVTHRNKVSTIKSIDMTEALRIVSEDRSEWRKIRPCPCSQKHGTQIGEAKEFSLSVQHSPLLVFRRSCTAARWKCVSVATPAPCKLRSANDREA